MSSGSSNPGSGSGSGGTNRKESVQTKERTQRPRKYKVIMFNDDYTPMEFVVGLLEQIFYRSNAEATRIMLTIHRTGRGVAGLYSREVAETKCNQGLQLAQSSGYPLLLSTEPE